MGLEADHGVEDAAKDDGEEGVDGELSDHLRQHVAARAVKFLGLLPPDHHPLPREQVQGFNHRDHRRIDAGVHEHGGTLRDPILSPAEPMEDGPKHAREQDRGQRPEAIGEQISRRLLPLPGDQEAKLREPGRMVLTEGPAGGQGVGKLVGSQKLLFLAGQMGGGDGGRLSCVLFFLVRSYQFLDPLLTFLSA